MDDGFSVTGLRSSVIFATGVSSCFVSIAACGRKSPLFAAFNGLKTRVLYVMLSLSQNIRSVLTRTHHERSFDHVGDHIGWNKRLKLKRSQTASAPCRIHRCAAKLKRQAEAVFYSFRFVFFGTNTPG